MACPHADRAPPRSLLHGPYVVIRVPTDDGDGIEEFTLPKGLVCESSTYFRSAFEGGFREAQEGTIALQDENAEVFRTYVAWLYAGRIATGGIKAFTLTLEENKQSHRFEEMNDRYLEDQHLIELYLFADRRDIPALQDEIIQELADTSSIIDCLLIPMYHDKIPKQSSLYQFIVEDQQYDIDWSEEYHHGSFYPKDFCIDVLCHSYIKTSYEKKHRHKKGVLDRLCDFHRHPK